MAFQQMPRPHKDVFDWLLDLLADVAQNETHTKMNPRNLCT